MEAMWRKHGVGTPVFSIGPVVTKMNRCWQFDKNKPRPCQDFSHFCSKYRHGFSSHSCRCGGFCSADRAVGIEATSQDIIMLKTFGAVIGFAVVCSLGPMGLASSSSAEARSCKSDYHRSWGKHSLTMFGARASARLAWKRASRALHGTRYDTWWPSRGKSMRCYTNRDGRKRCLAGARPCTIL